MRDALPLNWARLPRGTAAAAAIDHAAGAAPLRDGAEVKPGGGDHGGPTMAMTAAAATPNRTIHSRRSAPHLILGLLALLALFLGALSWLAFWGPPLDQLSGGMTWLIRALVYALPALWPLLLFAAWWTARSGRRTARVVAVDGDLVTITLANGAHRRWDMNLAQRVRLSRHGAEVRFAGADRMRLPWGAFAERDRRWIAAYLEQLQAKLVRRRSRPGRETPGPETAGRETPGQRPDGRQSPGQRPAGRQPARRQMAIHD